MPKKPTAPIVEEDPDALDDETFAELAADEERLHAALQDPQSIRTGQATSIAKTKPRRSTVGRPKAIITLNPEKWGDTDGAEPESATAPDDTVDTGAAGDPTLSPQQDDGAPIDREDASTQCEDEDMTLARQTPHTGKDWSKELPLSTDTPVQGKPAAKTGRKTIRDMLPAAKVYGTTGQLTAADLDRLDAAVPSTSTLSTKAKEPKSRVRPTVGDMRSLEERLTKHQLASAKMISTLQKELISQSQKHIAERSELVKTISRMESLLNPQADCFVSTTNRKSSGTSNYSGHGQ